jgi:hypothetical protein
MDGAFLIRATVLGITWPTHPDICFKTSMSASYHVAALLRMSVSPSLATVLETLLTDRWCIRAAGPQSKGVTAVGTVVHFSIKRFHLHLWVGKVRSCLALILHDRNSIAAYLNLRYTRLIIISISFSCLSSLYRVQ